MILHYICTLHRKIRARKSWYILFRNGVKQTQHCDIFWHMHTDDSLSDRQTTKNLHTLLVHYTKYRLSRICYNINGTMKWRKNTLLEGATPKPCEDLYNQQKCTHANTLAPSPLFSNWVKLRPIQKDQTCWSNIDKDYQTFVGHNIFDPLEQHNQTCWIVLDGVGQCWMKFEQTFHPTSSSIFVCEIKTTP